MVDVDETGTAQGHCHLGAGDRASGANDPEPQDTRCERVGGTGGTTRWTGGSEQTTRLLRSRSLQREEVALALQPSCVTGE